MSISKAAIVVATCGRPDVVGLLMEDLNKQTRLPCQVILSVVSKEDVPERNDRQIDYELIIGQKGTCIQRNAGIDSLREDVEVVLFLDDDYVPSRHAVENVCATFARYPDVVGVEGSVLADGVTRGGYSYEDSRRIVDDYDAAQDSVQSSLPITTGLQGLYGCNMAFRTAAIGTTRFDLALPLYGWQEDVDFSYRVGKQGQLAKAEAFTGVHRGVTGGRSPGVRLGYSQIANPFYLSRKGTMNRKAAYTLILRNMLANHVKAFRPEAWIDRKGRVKGNWIALIDALKGRLSPMNITSL